MAALTCGWSSTKRSAAAAIVPRPSAIQRRRLDADAEAAHLAFALERAQHVEDLAALDHLRRRRVHLIDVDRLAAQPPQARLAVGAHPFLLIGGRVGDVVPATELRRD